MHGGGETTIGAAPEAQDRWVGHVDEIVNGTLMPRANTITGTPWAVPPCLGPQGLGYRRKCDEIAAGGCDGFILAKTKARPRRTEAGRDDDR
jgi:cyclohexanone monooxygenase